MSKPKVQLSGEDGNVFNLISLCQKAMKKEGINTNKISTMQEKVFACGSYDEALQILMEYCDVS